MGLDLDEVESIDRDRDDFKMSLNNAHKDDQVYGQWIAIRPSGRYASDAVTSG